MSTKWTYVKSFDSILPANADRPHEQNWITSTNTGSKRGIDVAIVSGGGGEAVPKAIRTDKTTTANTTYVGKASVGSTTTAAVWQIFKIENVSGNLTITYADSDSNSDNIWDNRASLTYG